MVINILAGYFGDATAFDQFLTATVPSKQYEGLWNLWRTKLLHFQYFIINRLRLELHSFVNSIKQQRKSPFPT